MISLLKKSNRTLLELWTGMLLFGLISEIFVLIFSKSRGIHSASLWIGVMLAAVSSLHMYISLDRALDFPEGAAKKKITFAYMIRYTVVVAVFAVICISKIFNPLLTFLGFMTMKAGALIQPKIHKLWNGIFHETDPVPMTEEEYNALRREQAADGAQKDEMSEIIENANTNA